MQLIHYKSDFIAAINASAASPSLQGWVNSGYDFQIRITSGRPDYAKVASVATRTNGVLDGCYTDGDTVYVILQNHSLPTGQLYAEVTLYEPNTTYPSGHKTTICSWPLEIQLTVNGPEYGGSSTEPSTDSSTETEEGILQYNYKSDFTIVLAESPDCPWLTEGYDFDISITSGRRTPVNTNGVTCSRTNGELVNSYMMNGLLHIPFDNHSMKPGRLWALLHVQVPDSSYEDGVRDLYYEWLLDAELVLTGEADGGIQYDAEHVETAVSEALTETLALRPEVMAASDEPWVDLNQKIQDALVADDKEIERLNGTIDGLHSDIEELNGEKETLNATISTLSDNLESFEEMVYDQMSAMGEAKELFGWPSPVVDWTDLNMPKYVAVAKKVKTYYDEHGFYYPAYLYNEGINVLTVEEMQNFVYLPQLSYPVQWPDDPASWFFCRGTDSETQINSGSLKGIVLKDTTGCPSYQGLFAWNNKCEKIQVNLNSETASSDVYGLIAGCSSLKEIDIYGARYITSLGYWAWGTDEFPPAPLEMLRIYGTTDDQRINLSYAFIYGDVRSTEGWVVPWKNVTDTFEFMGQCKNCTGSFVAEECENLTNMGGMFDGCLKLESVTMKGFTKPVNAYCVCRDCNSITTLTLEHVGLNNIAAMCQSNFNLVTANINGSIAGCSSMNCAFQNCYKLASELSFVDTSKVSNMDCAFYNCYKLPKVSLYGMSNNPSWYQAFYGCQSLTEVDLDGATSVSNLYQAFDGCNVLAAAPNLLFDNCSTVQQCFYNCYALAEVGDINLSSCTTYIQMFYGCSGLTNVGNITLKTSYAANLHYMFYGCTALERIESITMGYTYSSTSAYPFFNCSALKYCLIKNLGQSESDTAVYVRLVAPNWGADSDENLRSLIDSVINNTFDRVAAGFTTSCTVYLHANCLARLTDEQKAQATAKGYTFNSVTTYY